MTMRETIQSDSEQDAKVVGSWYVEVTTSTQGTFPALLTFFSDGTVIGDESPAPFESAGHGSWVRRERGEVAYTFVALFGGEKGRNTGRLKVCGTLQHGAQSAGWEGPFSIRGFDAQGDTVFSDAGSTALRPILVESMD